MTKKRSFGVKKKEFKPSSFDKGLPPLYVAYNLVAKRMEAIRKEVLSIVKEIEREEEAKSQLNLEIENER